MPAATTHIEFARDVLRNLPKEVEIADRPAFFLGSQGPDLLFYTGYSVLPGTLKKYGNMLHDARPLPYMTWMRDHAGDEILRSYLYGFYCHYAMDAICHPIIEDFAERMAKQTGELHSVCHVRIESQLDVYTLDKEHRTIDDFDTDHWLKAPKKDADEIGTFLHQMFLEVFHLDLPLKKLQKAAPDTARSMALVKPSASKYRFVSGIETLLHQPHGLTALMLNDKVHCAILNTDHQPYTNLSCPDQTDHSSYDELYQKSLAKAIRMIKAYDPGEITVNFLGIPVKDQPAM